MEQVVVISDPAVSAQLMAALPEFGFTTAAYVVAAVLFILSLGGLSGQESAKRAVWYGIVGMALAVFATVFGPGSGKLWLVLVMFAIAAAICAIRSTIGCGVPFGANSPFQDSVW